MSREAEDLLAQMQKDFDNALEGNFEEVKPDADHEEEMQEKGQGQEDAGTAVAQSGESGGGEDTPPDTDEELEAQAQATQKDDEIEAMRSQMAEMQEKMDAQAAATEKNEPPAEEPKPTQMVDPVEALDDTQKQLLTQYAEEWPEVAQAENLQRDLMAQRLGMVLQTVFSQFEEKINKLTSRIEELSAGVDNTKLSSKYGDIDTLTTEVKDWVGKQPKLLQKTYNEVLDKGTTAEKQELFDLYKAQTKAPTVSQQQGGSRQASTEADSLQPVETRRSGAPVTDNVDPTDEKAAWADALKAI